MADRVLAKMAVTALSDFARVAVRMGVECDVNKIMVDIALKPHRPRGLPTGRMAVYCFLLNGRALKIGKAGPNSDARYRSQHYNPNSAGSTLAGSILKHPSKIGIASVPADSVGNWIKVHTDRINLLLPTSYGKPMLSELESFLHTRWRPTYEGPVAID